MSGETNSFDVAVIGGGHNGLVAAALLAKAGRRVVLCEAGPRFGGAACLSTLAPGIRAPQCAHVVSGFPRDVIRRLRLRKHGLQIVRQNMGRVALDPDGRHIPLGRKRRETAEAIFRWSRHDAEAWDAFAGRMKTLSEILVPLFTHTPPKLTPETWQDRLDWLGHYFRLRRLGRHAFGEALRILPSNAADIVEDAFETDLLRGALSFEAVLGGRLGPRAPGTAFTWLWRRAAEAASPLGTFQVAGGPASLTDTLATAAAAHGADLRKNARVAAIRTDDQRVTGLVLENGDEIDAPVVISSADPKATYLGLVGAANLDAGLARDIGDIRMGASTAKINLALERLPTFRNIDPEHLKERLIIAPSVPEVERASNPPKYGRMTDHPVMEVTIPSLADETLAPEGRHVLSALVQFAPYELEGGWDKGGDELVARVTKTLGEYAPDLPDVVMAGEVMTPPDIESHCGGASADWDQGELAFDQLMMMRPVPQLAHGGGPIAGLYLGGAGAHPGGGLNGRAGMLAARTVMAAHKRGRG